MKEVGDLEQILFLEQEKAKILENTTVEKPKKGSIATWYWHWKRNVLNQVQDRWESQTDSKNGSPDLGNLCVCRFDFYAWAWTTSDPILTPSPLEWTSVDVLHTPPPCPHGQMGKKAPPPHRIFN